MTTHASGLVEEYVAEFKEAFELFAREGEASYKELGSAMRAAGQNPSEEEVNDFIAKFDKNDGKFDLDTFLEIMADRLKGKDTVEDCTDSFKVFDKEGTGRMSAEEFKELMMGSTGRHLTEEEVDEMLREVEVDGSGTFDYAQLSETLSFDCFVK